jgi:hypothetical protein
MPENQELIDLICKLDKKIDKLSNTVNKIAKTLHLIPVTEKEERELQLLQRTNLQIAAKVNEDLNAMTPKNTAESASIFSIYEQPQNLYGDVVADDLLGGFANE